MNGNKHSKGMIQGGYRNLKNNLFQNKLVYQTIHHELESMEREMESIQEEIHSLNVDDPLLEMELEKLKNSVILQKMKKFQDFNIGKEMELERVFHLFIHP